MSRISYLFSIVVAASLVLTATTPAQVPQLLNYQGRVKVSGADFTGTGQFKFALVNAAGTQTFWSNDGTSVSGSQPAAAVPVAVQGGLYTVLLGDGTQPGMTGLTPGVFSNAGVFLRVWFSDSVNGWQQLSPDQRIAAVGYALMADDLRDGAVTSAKLAEGAVTAGKIAPGTVRAQELAPEAVTDSLAAAGQGAVPGGAMLISPVANSPEMLAAGYVSAGVLNSGDAWTPVSGATARNLPCVVWSGSEMLVWGGGGSGWRFHPGTKVWTPMSTAGQPVDRESAVCVWTGTEMIVWGGNTGTTYLNTGGRYNPATDTWTSMNLTNAPASRRRAAAVWTGTEMLVWGGSNAGVLGDGGRYRPVAGGPGSWSALPSTGAPAGRFWHTAVWTGNRMVVYGGSANVNLASFNDGARFNPAGGGSWEAIAAGPSPRYFHTAVWTGSRMLVWGGSDFNLTSPIAGGSSYDPVANVWQAITTAGAPPPRYQHSAVWTGNEMILWGGSTSNVNQFVYSAAGGRYRPADNTWTATAETGAPSGRILPNAVWTGADMIVWGGRNASGDRNDGALLRQGQTLYLYLRP